MPKFKKGDILIAESKSNNFSYHYPSGLTPGNRYIALRLIPWKNSSGFLCEVINDSGIQNSYDVDWFKLDKVNTKFNNDLKDVLK